MFRMFIVLLFSFITGFFFGAGMVRHHYVPPIVVNSLSSLKLLFDKEEQYIPMVDEHPRIQGQKEVPLTGADSSGTT